MDDQTLSDLDMMAIQVRTLYRLDGRARLLAVNETGEPRPDDPPAPRLFLGRTRQGNIWCFRHDLPDDVVVELDRLCRAEPVAEDLSAPPLGYAAMHAILEEHEPVDDEWRGPCYRFPAVLPVVPGAVEVTPANCDVLGPHFASLARSLPDVRPVAAVVHGAAVCACFCSRIGEYACEAGVETLPGHQGRGYASVAVTLWAELVRRRGLTPLYSTSWDNGASRGVARKLGLTLYGEDFSIT
ncbi:MAG: hypothetical protein RLZZ387_4152 [Chloroflexota bacterium]|jgi:GNAT superfamily N-acetyltransferase